jgi:hypothetical protein
MAANRAALSRQGPAGEAAGERATLRIQTLRAAGTAGLRDRAS